MWLRVRDKLPGNLFQAGLHAGMSLRAVGCGLKDQPGSHPVTLLNALCSNHWIIRGALTLFVHGLLPRFLFRVIGDTGTQYMDKAESWVLNALNQQIGQAGGIT